MRHSSVFSASDDAACPNGMLHSLRRIGKCPRRHRCFLAPLSVFLLSLGQKGHHLSHNITIRDWYTYVPEKRVGLTDGDAGKEVALAICIASSSSWLTGSPSPPTLLPRMLCVSSLTSLVTAVHNNRNVTRYCCIGSFSVSFRSVM